MFCSRIIYVQHASASWNIWRAGSAVCFARVRGKSTAPQTPEHVRARTDWYPWGLSHERMSTLWMHNVRRSASAGATIAHDLTNPHAHTHTLSQDALTRRVPNATPRAKTFYYTYILEFARTRANICVILSACRALSHCGCHKKRSEAHLMMISLTCSCLYKSVFIWDK